MASVTESFFFKSKLDQHSGKCNGILKSETYKVKDIEYKEISNDVGKKQFQCCKCEKVFEKSILALHHIYKVHREKKVKCDKCNKMFAYKSDMEKHVPICNGVLRTKMGTGHIMNHFVINLGGIKKFKCTKCL